MRLIFLLSGFFLISCTAETGNDDFENVISNVLEIDVAEIPEIFYAAESFQFADEPPPLSGQILIRTTENYIYILDKTTKAVYLYDIHGEQISIYSKPGRGPEELFSPVDMTVDKDRNVYILDLATNKVVILDSDLKFVHEFVPADGLRRFSKISAKDPDFIAINNPVLNGSVFDVYDLKGTLQRSFGEVENFDFQKSAQYDPVFTQIQNTANLIFDGDFIYVMYYTRPLLEVYNANLDLVHKVKYNSELISLRREIYANRLKERLNESEGRGRPFQYYFLDMTLNDNGLIGLYTIFDEHTIYYVNSEGEVQKKVKFNVEELAGSDETVFIRHVSPIGVNQYIGYEIFTGRIVHLKPE